MNAADFRFPSTSRTAVLRGGPFDAQVREVLPAHGWPRVIRVPEWTEDGSSRIAALHEYVPGADLGPTAREYVHDRRDAL